MLEPIKTCSNIEFDVIYSDGGRQRVPEGVLFEADGQSMVLHLGTSRKEVLFAVQEALTETIESMGLHDEFKAYLESGTGQAHTPEEVPEETPAPVRYEIINPSDKCYIYAHDVRLAKIACLLLGGGMYGLKDETEKSVLPIFADAETALGMTSEECSAFIQGNRAELAKVFRSFTYAGERTSLNDIGKKAERYAAMFEKGGKK